MTSSGGNMASGSGTVRARTILVLDGALPSGSLVPGWTIRRAFRPLTAMVELARARPDLLVVSPAVPWHVQLVQSLPEVSRPAVLAVGEGNLSELSCDDWLVSAQAVPELVARASLAMARGRSRRQAARRAYVDGLTTLPNRRALTRALLERAAQSRRGGDALSLVRLDLNGFKAVNDRLGHQEGDRLLRQVGRALASVVRSSEVCGRAGGDEFALVLSGNGEEASRAASRVLNAIALTGITATAGIATLRPGEELRGLYRRADDSLRTGKRNREASLIWPDAANTRVAPPGLSRVAQAG